MFVHDALANQMRKDMEGKFAAEEICTIVHSVFARAVNLQAGDELWTIASLEVGRGPFGVLLPPAEFSAWKRELTPSDRLYLSKDGIRSAFGTLDWSGRFETYVLTQPRVALQSRFLSQNLAYMKRLHELYVPSVRDDIRKALDAMLEQFCLRINQHFEADDWASLAQHLCGGLGMGSGLTPSADDIVLGWMAVVAAEGSPCRTDARCALKKVADAAHENTTDVSAQMLKSASKGYYKQSIVDLILRIQQQAISAEHLAEVLSIGHSSGMDILRGIHLGFLSLLQRRNEWQ